MKTALLLIVCMQQGYWYAGQEATVTVRWAEGVRPVEAVWQWQLKYGQIALAEGESELGKDEPATLNIAVPQVRVRTPMTLAWQLVSDADGQVIEQGSIDIHVFANDPLADAARRLDGQRVAVMSQSPALHEAMKKAGIAVQAIDKAGELATTTANVIIVGPDTLPKNAVFHQPLIDHAEAGATVIVLRHAEQESLFGIPLIERQLRRPVHLRPDHALHHGLTQSDIDSLVDERSVAMRVTKPDNATPIIYEKPGEPKAEAVDTLCLVQQIGKGRLVLCQLSLDGWSTDPRTRQLLSNMLDFAQAPVADPDAKDRPKSDHLQTQPAAAAGAMP